MTFFTLSLRDCLFIFQDQTKHSHIYLITSNNLRSDEISVYFKHFFYVYFERELVYSKLLTCIFSSNPNQINYKIIATALYIHVYFEDLEIEENTPQPKIASLTHRLLRANTLIVLFHPSHLRKSTSFRNRIAS